MKWWSACHVGQDQIQIRILLLNVDRLFSTQMGSLKQFVYTTSPAILLLLAIFDVVEAAPTVPEKSAEAWKNAADDSNGQWSRQQMYIMQRPPSAFGSLHQSMDSQASGMLMKGFAQKNIFKF